MSTFYPAELECPSCGHRFTVEVVRGIHISRLPRARQQIIDGSFQVFSCPECSHRMVAEGPTVYTDFQRHQYVAIESSASTTWQSAELRHQTIFHQSFDCGPTIAQEMGRKFTRRVVFGLEGLREKLILWDAGLDDYVVEAVKGDLAADLGGPGAELLRLATLLEGGHMMFARFPPRPRPEVLGEPLTYKVEVIDFVTAPADHYQGRLRERARIADDFPWLRQDWMVDISEGHQLV